MIKRRLSLLVPILLFLAAPVLTDGQPSGDAGSPAAASEKTAPVDLSTTKGDSDDLARQLADTQDKLSTALHSYSLLQDENTQLKADAEKSAADKAAVDAQLAEANNSIATLKSQAAAATQVDGLRDQLRQSQNQIAALATENAGLRTRLALMNSAPAGPVFPLRPGAAAQGAAATAEPSATLANPSGAEAPAAGTKTDSAKTDATASATATASPRIYTVVAGDSLSKISKKCYGTASRWTEILAANRDVIKNENNVAVGAKLKIP